MASLEAGAALLLGLGLGVFAGALHPLLAKADQANPVPLLGQDGMALLGVTLGLL